ncbi:MAG: ABC transporter permease subunit [Micromonosporaceae bacterium]|nr:ABC transporter permease subunit [Micromonosporaceae bacterium]
MTRPRARRHRRTAALFLAPALVILCVLVAYPILHTVWLSLHDPSGSRFVGLANYAEMFTSEDTRRALTNNAIWVVVAPTVVTVLGLTFAVLTERVRLVNAFRLALFMPMAISFLAAGVTFRLVYDEDPNRGLLNAAIVAVHDSFAPPSPYPGATVRAESGLLADEDGAISTTGAVGAGRPVLLPLVGLPADRVPDRAEPAATPAGGPGVRGVVWRDFLRGGAGTPGVVDPGERGLPGLAVEVWRGGELVAETRTDGHGQFAVPELAGGGYTVRLAAGNFTEPFRGLTWLGPGLVTPAIIGSYIWVWAGFAMVVISAGLASIPREAVESARVDGATEWQVLRLVTIPLVRPVTVVVAVTLGINVLKIFDLVMVLAPESAQPEANVLGLELYHASFTQLNTGLGSALAVLLFTLVLPGMAWRARVLRRQESR